MPPSVTRTPRLTSAVPDLRLPVPANPLAGAAPLGLSMLSVNTGRLIFARLLTLSGLATFLPALISGCSPEVPQWSERELLPAGNASISASPFASFDKPVANLPTAQKPDFYAGRALAAQPWVKAPTITDARDGLGPLFNARSCLACHKKGGKGDMPTDDSEPLFSAFVRLSIPGEHPQLGSVPEPSYGEQLQGQSISLLSQMAQHPNGRDRQDTLPAEAQVYIQWQEQAFSYPDGSRVSLRSPQLDIRQPGYGEFHPQTRFSLRLAPTIIGMGLIEQIRQSDIDALADPQDLNGDGISGRINSVWNPYTEKTEPGRFGLKANRPDLLTTVAAAFAGDIGISNPLFPAQPCTDLQSTCNAEPDGNNTDGFELPQDLLELVVHYNRNLGVPVRTMPADNEGRTLFYETGCAACHQPSYVTTDQGPEHLSGQTIWPFSDFLLHDMGPGLADNRHDFDASGSEWRTAPLWGVGQYKAVNGHAFYLHDGRARSIEEAILWHGGEAKAAKDRFTKLPSDGRESLLTYVSSL